MPDLDKIARDHDGGKSSRYHGYAELYEKYFEHLYGVGASLLEIGIGSGASLTMWRQWFYKAKIFGIDNTVCPEVPGTTSLFGSQNDVPFLTGVAEKHGPFDAVIDDGSHRWSDQITAFQTLWRFVNPNGWYVIEDLHCSYWEDCRYGDQSITDFLKHLMDELQIYGKSGYGKRTTDPQWSNTAPHLSLYERSLGAMHFHPGIVFIQRRDRDL